METKVYTTSFSQMRSATIPANTKIVGDAYIIQLALPGFEKTDINLKLEGEMLHVLANSKQNSTHPNRRWEFDQREKRRTFRLPKDIAFDQISAKMEQGILELMIPKMPKPTAKSINIH